MAGIPLSQASQLPHLIDGVAQTSAPPNIPVGVGLPAIAVVQSLFSVADTRTLGRAVRLPHLIDGVAQTSAPPNIPVGAGLPAIAVVRSLFSVADTRALGRAVRLSMRWN